MLFKCPLPAALTAIPATNCPVKFDQIQKIAFGRKTSVERFADDAAIALQASWTALLTATDEKKIVVSPFFTGFTIPVGEPIKTGGNDNTTLNGVAELQGGSSVVVPFIIKNVSAETAKGLRALCAETQVQPGETNLEGYFFATNDNIIYDGRDGNVQGFEIFNLFVPDVATEGFNANNTYNCSFELRFGWSEYFKMVKASFNPRTL
ncbi:MULTISPECIES: hypothetical protein [unclassified Sphingobacterium]|uniref:hypothetical protein n=1 Tax=unclassified Sphingobacterium TaxID=2609468 RepID=UPI0025E776F6|nr:MULTISPECIES: hypothetical protein [unclassified Sphingobacterium]